MNRNLKVDVAKVMISAIESRMQGGMNPQVIEELKKILEAWERVRDAALASQKEPDDFVQGEPGVAPCQCQACQAGRVVKQNHAGTTVADATLADEIAAHQAAKVVK